MMELRTVDPTTLKVNPDNPRRMAADPHADAQLVASIQAIGLLQPPVIVEDGEGGLEIVFGHRRVAAAIEAGLAEILALVGSADAKANGMAALVENSVRANLGPVDLWRAIERLAAQGWNEEAIAAALALPARVVRKLRLLASIHPPLLDHMAKDLPREHELRLIASASREEQAAMWKKRKPKKGETVCWWEIARAFDTRRLPASRARFDDVIAKAFGIVWQEDLFAPADEDSRYTTQVDAFLAAQLEWVKRHLPENGVVLELGPYGEPRLPPRARRSFGGPPGPGDRIGYVVRPQTGEIETIAFRLPEPARSVAMTAGKTPRPPMTRKGVEIIGELRTEALHQALRVEPIEDHTLLGLLVLAFGALNVSVQPGMTASGYGNDAGRIARQLGAGGTLTRDLASVRAAAREVLALVLSCREDRSRSGAVARIAGTVVGADRHLPNMATEEFLRCLSRPALNAAAQASGLSPFDKGKDTRAALCRAFKEGSWVHPAAGFALTEEEITRERRRHEVRSAEPDEEAHPEAGGTEAAAAFMGNEESGEGAPEAA